MELPYIAGKTIQATSTDGWGFNIDKVSITFTDGTSLILTPDHGYIRARLEPAAIDKPLAAQPAVTPQTRWPEERR